MLHLENKISQPSLQYVVKGTRKISESVYPYIAYYLERNSHCKIWGLKMSSIKILLYANHYEANRGQGEVGELV